MFVCSCARYLYRSCVLFYFIYTAVCTSIIYLILRMHTEITKKDKFCFVFARIVFWHIVCLLKLIE